MNLTSLFNFNYLKENIKKSKAIILLCILLIPIIGGIILLVNCSQNSSFLPSIYEVSAPMLFGMYIIPIVLSITLFSFIYKRGSVDFTLSMPINKKQIFLTNTIGGIIIILLMQIINFIITLVISLIYSNIILNYRMLLDIFIICFISYIFVFTSCNIAISVCSNKITTVIVTLLILFLVPFVNTFITTNGFKFNNSYIKVTCNDEECVPNIYECTNIECENNEKNNIYVGNGNKINSTTYTMPYNLIWESIFVEDNKINIDVSLIKMAFLSIVYIFCGLILFMRKKFEVVGTSFKNEKVHIIVRTLTTIPIICIMYIIIKDLEVFSNDIFIIILLLALIFAYLIIYDLITRRKVTNFIKMFLCIIIVFSITYIVGLFFNDSDYSINAKDITEITFVDDNNIDIGSTENKDAINYIIGLLLDSNIRGETYNVYHIKMNVNGDMYKVNVYTTKDDYNYINNILVNDKEYLKDLNKYKNNKIFGMGFIDGYINSNDISELSNMIINEYKMNNDALINNNYDSDVFGITLYVYDNYTVRNTYVNVFNNKELSLNIIDYYNTNTKKNLNNIDDVYSYNINDVYYGYAYSDISQFIIDNINDEFDITKNYSYITMYSSYGRNVFFTNKVNELSNIIDKSIDNIEDTIEYKNDWGM